MRARFSWRFSVSIPVISALAALIAIGGRPCSAQAAKLLEKQNVVEAARPPATWMAADVGQILAVKDRLRTGELSRALVEVTSKAVLRMNQLSTVTILPPSPSGQGAGIDLLQGAAYFLSRERPEDIRIRTPSANGIARGTEFHLAVDQAGTTTLVMLEGEVEIWNEQGRENARSGEQIEIRRGRAPHKTTLIEATNIIQWCLYYPAVIFPEELQLTPTDEGRLARSTSAYRAGNLPGALRAFSGSDTLTSAGGRIYAAAMQLTAGQVNLAERTLALVPRQTPGRSALQMLIAAVTLAELSAEDVPFKTASDWMACSYWRQSRGDLEGARSAAREATRITPQNGFAWTRLAEVEFSFGRVREAVRALKNGRELTPRNAHAAVLEGFLQSAQNHIRSAEKNFEEAIALDPTLGTGWLGRGMCRIRRGDAEGGRRDLQAAAALEPNRSLFRSYLGKAWSNAGDNVQARLELDRAIDFDRNDPTPWLYRALQNKQENRLNAAVRDLEESIALNMNRSVYRSRFLLDQDNAVRSANLASIYQLNGMREVAVREATRAVTADYANPSAHLFLANSYNDLRDPRRINLRYETPFNSELLIANLLAPVGGGTLSQYVSEQEYSKLFESDGFGTNLLTEYLSTGEFRHIASLFGTFGNVGFSLDADYFYDNGRRVNHDASRFESSAKFKVQLTPWDIFYFEAEWQNLRTGDVRQLYGDRDAIPSLRINEEQEPGGLLAGYRHEWAPGHHTLLLAGRLASEFTLRQDARTGLVFDFFPTEDFLGERPQIRDSYSFVGIEGRPFAEFYDLDLEIGTVELQQIATFGPQTVLAGVRYQAGAFHMRSVLEYAGLIDDPPFDSPAALADFDGDFERISIYLYHTVQLTRYLTLTGGLTYDRIHYPNHLRSAPLQDSEQEMKHWSPKLGITFEPVRWVRLRGAYAEAISGVSLDESTRLEPTQIAGFNQGFRTLVSESVAGSVSAAQYKIAGVALDIKLPSSTYFGVGWSSMKQESSDVQGEFDSFDTGPDSSIVPGPGFAGRFDYEERVFTATVNQLIAERWSFATSYRVTWSEFHETFEDLKPFVTTSPQTIRHGDAELHQLNLAAIWNQEDGYFARLDALWTRQATDGFTPAEPGDDFWQLNATVGYRFRRNAGEISVGVLNLLNTDYQLEPLNPFIEVPHECALALRCRISF